MESNHKSYSFENSRERIKSILDSSDTSYEELDSIPSRDKLTFNNGFYVNCTALFVDMRDSSQLPSKYKRPTLAKIYRSYISEVVAVMNGDSHCSEINIEGDCVWGIFDTPYKTYIDDTFSTAARISSLIDWLNCSFKKKGINEISIGIGLDYGRALMIKAGYNGSGINNVVYMGDVVNQASKLASYGNKSWSDNELMVSDTYYSNLNDDNKSLLSYNTNRYCYHGNVVNTSMNDWVKNNCSK